MFVDAHAHIDFPDFDADLEEVISKAWEAGVRTVIIPSIEAQTIAKAAAISERFPFVWFTAGWHPNDADSFNEPLLRRFLDHPKCVAIGEIGLDFYHKNTDETTQLVVLVRQLEIARERGLPAVVHIREAWPKAIEILDDFSDLACYFHSFSGGHEELDWVVARGGFIGLGGPVTFKNFKETEIVSRVPLGRMLLETDSPFLAPHPNRGSRNEPANIVVIAKKIAEMKSTALEEIEKATSENLRRFMRLPLPMAISEPLGAKRSLSQNFLVDGNIVRKIVDNVGKNSVIVEIGAGNGEISAGLSENCTRFWAIEPDMSRIETLKITAPKALVIPRIAQDIDFIGLSRFEGQKLAVVGNLPYKDSSQIIFHLLEHRESLYRAVIMIQSELADRVCSGPGSKQYGIPSVLLSLYFEIHREFDVHPGSFRPVPRVVSTVISLTPRISPPEVDFKLLSAVVKSAFSQRRKTILNSMRALFGGDNLQKNMLSAGINPSSRAEQIAPERFIALTKAIAKAGE